MCSKPGIWMSPGAHSESMHVGCLEARRRESGASGGHIVLVTHGHGPRLGLFLIGVACASTLLSSAVGITITASLYHSTHSALRNARIATQLDSFTRTAVASGAVHGQLRVRAAPVRRRGAPVSSPRLASRLRPASFSSRSAHYSHVHHRGLHRADHHPQLLDLQQRRRRDGSRAGVKRYAASGAVAGSRTPCFLMLSCDGHGCRQMVLGILGNFQ